MTPCEGCPLGSTSYLLRCNNRSVSTMERFDRADEEGIGGPNQPCGWRTIMSAWLVAFMIAVLWVTGDALASLHYPARHAGDLDGVIIPRHDPSSPGPDEVAASDWLERVKAEAYGAN
jgi:hypothetical protein